ALMLLPWTIRNIVKLRSPVVVSTGYGPALCMSRHPGARGDNAGHGSPQRARNMARYCLPSLAGVPLRDQEVKVNNYAMSRAVKFVVEHPFEEVRLWLPRSRYAYREDHDALEDVAPHTSPRRRALSLLGAAGAGAVVFGACGGSTHNASPATTTSSRARSAGTGGSNAAADADVVVTPAMFENAATCRVTPAAI